MYLNTSMLPMIRSLPRFLLSLSMMSAVLGVHAQSTQFDVAFDGDGELAPIFPAQGDAEYARVLRQVAPSPGATLLVAGTDWNEPEWSPIKHPRALIGRVSAVTGQPVASYGGQGTGASTLGDLRMAINDLVALPDGSALICGDRYTDAGPQGVAARVDADGVLDPNWGSGSGIQSYGPSHCYALELLGDGRTVMVGSTLDGGYLSKPVAKFLDADGQSLDEVLLDAWGPVEYEPTRATAVAEQPGLGIVVMVGAYLGDAGTENLHPSVLWLVALTPEGQFDQTFGAPKLIPHSIDQNDVDGFPRAADQIDIDPTGRIRLGLTRTTDQNGRFGVTAWNRNVDGSTGLETTFLPARGPLFDLGVGASTLAPDGKSLVLSVQREYGGACSASLGSPHAQRRLHLVRTTAGTLQADTGFDGDGQFDWEPVSLTPSPDCIEPSVFEAEDVMVQRNGRIVVLGSYIDSPPSGAPSHHATYPMLTQFVGDTFGTSPWDTDPDALSFPAASARPNALAESEFRQISGLDAGLSVPAYVLGGQMRVGFEPWSDRPRWVKNGDWLQLRVAAPTSTGANATASLFVGGIRAHNSWDSLGARKRADFVVSANRPALPGARCSEGGLNSHCTAPIPDQGSVSSSINFVNAGSCNYVDAIRVGVDIEHTYIGDLRITLTDPNGQVFVGGSEGIVTLLDRPAASAGAGIGSCTGRDIVASFDDGAAIDAQTSCRVPVDLPALSGDIIPAHPLSALLGRRTTGNDGIDSSGLWTLKIEDLASGDSGHLLDWSLDLDCSATVPGVSDLSVAVSGQSTNPLVGGTGEAVGGDGVNITWTVTNNGPSATGNGRFRASLPTGLTDAIENPAWGCSTTAGGSCTPAIGCFGACLGSEIDAGLSLPVGGTATFFATGTLTELAGDGTLVVNGRSSVPAAIGGTRDNNPDNDSVQLQMPVLRITHIRATAQRQRWQGNELSLEVDISNLGPSQSNGFTADITLPVGMQISQVGCRRGNLPCDAAFTSSADNRITLTHGNGMLPLRTPYTALLTATWTGSGAPGDVIVQAYRDATAFDEDNGAPISFPLTPPPDPNDIIFRNGFDSSSNGQEKSR